MNTNSIRAAIGVLAMWSVSTVSMHAVTLFTESMGTVASTTSIATHNTNDGFDNDSFVFSGTGDIRTSSASSGYTGASGTGNAFLTNNSTSTFVISGIDTRGYTAGSLGLTFGAFKSTTASNMTELVVEWQTTGAGSWNTLSFSAQATGSGTANWRLISITGTSISIDDDVSIRFKNTSLTPQFRVDDVALSGIAAVPEPSAYATIAGGLVLACVVMHRRRRALVNMA